MRGAGKRFVYIFGAGASAAEGAPVMRDFLRTAYKFFGEEQKEADLEIVWEFMEFFFGSRKKIRTARDMAGFPDIDELFSIVDWYLLHNQSFSFRFPRSRLYDLKTALVKLISMTLDKILPEEKGIHRRFVSKVIENDGGTSVFISTNYDVFLDRAIGEAGYRVEYGFYGHHGVHVGAEGSVPLYKLHGSLNWSFCPLCGEISAHEDKVANLLFDSGSILHCLNCGSDGSQVMIVAPTLYKSYRISRLHNIWDCAAQAISSAGRLVFIGYSLSPAETSVIATIKRAMNCQEIAREIIVVNPCRKACERYRRIFGPGIKIIRTGFTGELYKELCHITS